MASSRRGGVVRLGMAWALATGVIVAPTAAWSQPAPQTPATTDVDVARQYFETGVTAMSRNNFSEALTAFENSYRVRRAGSVALNLGVCLVRLGRLVEARVRLQEFQEMATAPQHTQHDAEVSALLGEIARRLGRVRVTELTPPTARVILDGRAATLNEASEAMVDPGEHRVQAEADGWVTADQRVTVAEGGVAPVQLVLVRAAAQVIAPTPTPTPVVVVAPPPPTPHPEAPPSTPITSRWWFWTGIGVVAAGVTVGVIVALSGERALPANNTNTLIQTVQGGEVARW